MTLIPREFYSRISLVSRFKKSKLVIPAGIFFVVLAAGAGIYFYSQKSEPKTSKVAAEQKTRSLPQEWLVKYFLTEDENAPHVGGPDGDPDGDILTNHQEYLYGTNPTMEDTDDDGDIDSYEVAFGNNPNGTGELAIPQPAKDYIKDYIKNNEKFSDITEDNILAEVKSLFMPDQQVVMDFPEDKEIITINKNDVPAFEKYYDDTVGLVIATPQEAADIELRLTEGMTAEEIDRYIEKLEAAIKILKATPVPSQIVNIHRLKIAGLRAGVRMFEMVRDDYRPAEDIANEQFWPDLFYQITIIQTADAMEIEAWRELGLKLKDVGGL